MPSRSERLLGYIEDKRDEVLAFTEALVATPSINPPGDERAVAVLVQEKLAELGLGRAEVAAREAHRPNLMLRLRGKGGGPTLLYCAHMDTKPVGEAAALWETDPLTPTIREGRMYGLGTADMKGALAGMIYAAAGLEELCPDRAGDLLLVFAADEERGSGLGARYLVEHGLLEADFAFIGEPQGIGEEFEFLPVISRGSALFKVIVRGTQMHSSLSNALPSVNASVKAGWAMWRMHEELRDRIRYERTPLAPLGITVNVGVTLSGGVFYGVYPGHAEFGVDVRTLPGMTWEGLMEDVQSFLDELRHEDPELDVVVEPAHIGFREASVVSPEAPFVRALRGAARRVLGRELPLGTFAGVTDAYAFQVKGGIPTVPGFGPGLLPMCHGPNEWASVEGIIQASKVYVLAAAEYLQ